MLDITRHFQVSNAKFVPKTGNICGPLAPTFVMSTCHSLHCSCIPFNFCRENHQKTTVGHMGGGGGCCPLSPLSNHPKPLPHKDINFPPQDLTVSMHLWHGKDYPKQTISRIVCKPQFSRIQKSTLFLESPGQMSQNWHPSTPWYDGLAEDTQQQEV